MNLFSSTTAARRLVLAATTMALAASAAACKPSPQAQPAPVTSAPAATTPTAAVTSKAAAPVKNASSPTPKATPSVTAASTGLTAATFRSVVPAMPKTVSVKNLGPIRQNARVGGRDGGQSTGYGDKSVWVFNDTTLQNPWGFLSNSAAMTTDRNAGDGLDLRSSNGTTIDNGAAPVETVPRTAAEKTFEKAHAAPPGGCQGSGDQYCGAIFGFWPGPVFADEVRHRVLFTYGKLCRGGQSGTPCSGPLGKGLGMGIAAIDMNSGAVTRLVVGTGTVTGSVEGKDPTIFFGPGDKAGAGSGAALVVEDQAYLYGQCDYFDCTLARVPLAEITDRSAWRHYDGGGWVADPGAAKKVGAQPGAAGNTVFYSAGLKAYVDVYMPYGSNEVWYRVGGSPFGPWSKGVKLTSTPGDKARPNYALYGHAEFAEKDGRVQYLSYFNQITGAQDLIRWELA